MKRIYLDNNATTPLDPRIKDSLLTELTQLIGNPSSSHFFGQQVKARLVQARNSIAAFLRVKSNEIIFTSGGTEGINMVMRGIFGLNPSGHLITSNVEHSSVRATAKQLEQNGCEVSYLSPGLWGAVSPDAVKAAIRPNTKLIVLMAVNNETGVKTAIEEVAAIAKEAKIPFLVDGVALLGKELFSIPEGVSAMCFSGHKLHAPQGIGFSFIRSNLKLHPLITGGGQEYGRRAGTGNLIGILALEQAIELLNQELPHASERMKSLRDRFENSLKNKLPYISINGLGPRVVNTSNVAFEGINGESLLMSLDLAGIAASHGSACTAGALEPSPVLLNMGIPLDLVRSSIRFSLSRFTTEEEIDQAIEVITRVCKEKN